MTSCLAVLSSLNIGGRDIDPSRGSDPAVIVNDSPSRMSVEYGQKSCEAWELMSHGRII